MKKKEQKTNYNLENIQPNLKGQEIIKFIAKTLPNQPGVYQMEDEDGKILYQYNEYKLDNYYDSQKRVEGMIDIMEGQLKEFKETCIGSNISITTL